MIALYIFQSITKDIRGSILSRRNSMMMVSVLSPSCVVPSEANSPTCGICQWLAADMQPVKAGKQEEEGAEGVEDGDGGVEEVAGQHGGQGKAEQGGGQHHIEGRLDEEAGEAGEKAEEGHDAEEGEGGVGGDRGEVDEAGGDRLEKGGDVRRTTGIPAGVTVRMRRRPWRRLLATLVYSSKVLIVMCLRPM